MKTRKGFTLVELLIVIAIVGVLAAMMTMSSTSGTASAKAATIVSGLRTVKSAVTMFTADYVTSTDLSDKTKAMASFNALSSDYIDDASLKTLQGNYVLVISEDKGGAWYAGYKFSDGDGAVKKRIASMASDLGLYGGSGGELGDKALATYAVANDTVFMQVRASTK